MRAPVHVAPRASLAVAPRKIAAPARKRSPLEPLALLAPDPINQAEIEDPEVSTEVELTQLQSGFRERMKVEAERFKQATTVDFYFVVVCNTGQQAEALMKGLGVGAEKIMVDGRIIADHLGIALPPDPPPAKLTRKLDSKLAALVRRL